MSHAFLVSKLSKLGLSPMVAAAYSQIMTVGKGEAASLENTPFAR